MFTKALATELAVAPSQAAHRRVPQDDAAEEPRAGGLPAERVGPDAGEHLLGAARRPRPRCPRRSRGPRWRRASPSRTSASTTSARASRRSATSGSRSTRPRGRVESRDVLRIRRRERFRLRLRAARVAHRAGGGRARALAAAGACRARAAPSSTRCSPTSGDSCAPAICSCSTTRACFRRGSSDAAIRAAAKWSACSWASRGRPETRRIAGRGGVGRAGAPGPETEAGRADGVRAATGSVLHGEILARRFQGRRTVRLWTDDPGGRRAPSSIASATCRCRRTSSATIGPAIASATRRCTPPSAARLPRRPRACTSPHGQLASLATRGRRAGARDAARRLRHVQAGARRAGRGARGRSRVRTRCPEAAAVGADPRAPRGPPHHRRRHDDRARARIARRLAPTGDVQRRPPARRGSSSTPGTGSAWWTA